MVERVWICVSPETYDLLKKQAVEKRFHTRTRYMLHLIDQYNGEELLRDRQFRTNNRKMTSMDISLADSQLLEAKVKMSGMKKSEFIRNLAYTKTIVE